MDTLTLIDQKEQLRKKAEALIAGAEKELRKLNEGETLELNHLKEEIANIDSQSQQQTTRRESTGNCIYRCCRNAQGWTVLRRTNCTTYRRKS